MRRIIHDFVDYNERVVGSFAERLESGLSTHQQRLITGVAEEAKRHGMPLYTVGGLPRDLWMGRQATDLDLVVEGDAVQLGKALATRYGGRLTVHPHFGTAKWDLNSTTFRAAGQGHDVRETEHRGHYLDLVTARSESYGHPGALPTVRPGTIEDDIHRRDFTINTLAVRLDGGHYGELRDEFNALEDLERGSIRVLHEHSFEDDPTRMYRAARYEGRFSFRMDGYTEALVPAARHLVTDLSAQRLRNELDLVLDEESAGAILRRLSELHLLAVIDRSVPTGEEALKRVDASSRAPRVPIAGWSKREGAWSLWLLDLKQAQIAALGRRLHMTRVRLENIAAAARLYAKSELLASYQPSRCAELLDEYPAVAVYAVSLAVSGRSNERLEKYLEEWRRLSPITRGNDLQRLGLAPGPAYRRILTELRKAWIDGLVQDAAGERRLLGELIEEAKRGVKREPRAVTKARRRHH